MKKLMNTKEKGFTIIEVMIVLAIAALILVVVLVAIPQLQRNQRNQARQSMTARIVTEINNYAGNNNGNYPTLDKWGDFVDRYLSDNNAYEDPLTGDNIAADPEDPAVDLIDDEYEAGTASYHDENALCDGESIQDGESRNFAFQVQLEGGAVYCLDNR